MSIKLTVNGSQNLKLKVSLKLIQGVQVFLWGARCEGDRGGAWGRAGGFFELLKNGKIKEHIDTHGSQRARSLSLTPSNTLPFPSDFYQSWRIAGGVVEETDPQQLIVCAHLWSDRLRAMTRPAPYAAGGRKPPSRLLDVNRVEKRNMVDREFTGRRQMDDQMI